MSDRVTRAVILYDKTTWEIHSWDYLRENLPENWEDMFMINDRDCGMFLKDFINDVKMAEGDIITFGDEAFESEYESYLEFCLELISDG